MDFYRPSGSRRCPTGSKEYLIGVIMFSRQQYMNKECSHSEYYAQFITPIARLVVLNSIGRNRILDSTNPHFNDIPLHLWDRLSFPIKSMKEAGDFLTLAGKVCIAKEIARQYKESKSND